MIENTFNDLSLTTTQQNQTDNQQQSSTTNSLVANLNELSTLNNFNQNKNFYNNKPKQIFLMNNNRFYASTTTPPYHTLYPHQTNENYLNQFGLNKNFFQPQPFQTNFNDRKNYLKVKKEQNMHKLWPHSVHSKVNTEPVENEQDANKDEKNDSENQPNESLNDNVATQDTNEKTPMCLIHELVKFNKIKHEYVLLDEKGSAHKKTFYVQLKLGVGQPEEESYQANGTSIKKAQHTAAEIALNETKFKKPVPRVKSDVQSSKKPITQNNKKDKTNQTQSNTVKLNSLCMKHGLRTSYEHQMVNKDYENMYTNFNSPEYKPFIYQPVQMFSPNYGRNFGYGNQQIGFPFRKQFNRIQRYGAQTTCGTFTVKLKIADQEFEANGNTLQSAKHNVASKALEYFSKQESLDKAKIFVSEMNQNKIKSVQKPATEAKAEESEAKQITEEKQEPKITILARAKTESVKPEIEKTETTSASPSTSKSEISILLEYSCRLKKTVTFELIHESGPSHIKKFVTKCSIGQKSETDQKDDYLEVMGEGNSKKQSKQNSAIEMLKLLREKYDLSKYEQPNPKKTESVKKDESKTPCEKDKQKQRKNRSKNIVLLNKTSPDYGNGTINPITRLIQIQQARKESEPVFELISSINRYRKNDYTKSRSEFTMSVSVKNSSGEVLKCEAKGSTKKMAKQNAAEAMLIKLGYPSKSQINLKPVLKTSDESHETENKNEKRVKFVDEIVKDQDDEKKKVNRINKTSTTQSKLRIYKDQVSDVKESKSFLEKSELQTCSKICGELLDSIKNNETEFYSKTAEDYLSKKETEDSVVLTAKDFSETQESKIRFKILTNGNEVNHKGALDYVANIFNFKCNYQSILGRDGSINSYLTLSIFPQTDKPFSGQGSTHVQSSNGAALNALQYLANQNK